MRARAHKFVSFRASLGSRKGVAATVVMQLPYCSHCSCFLFRLSCFTIRTGRIITSRLINAVAGKYVLAVLYFLAHDWRILLRTYIGKGIVQMYTQLLYSSLRKKVCCNCYLIIHRLEFPFCKNFPMVLANYKCSHMFDFFVWVTSHHLHNTRSTSLVVQ